MFLPFRETFSSQNGKKGNLKSGKTSKENKTSFFLMSIQCYFDKQKVSSKGSGQAVGLAIVAQAFIISFNIIV